MPPGSILKRRPISDGIAVGMTMEEIADVEGVKYNSVRVKLREAMKRFDVRSKAHLTALAIRRKLM